MKKCLLLLFMGMLTPVVSGQQHGKATTRFEKRLEKRSLFISDLFIEYKHLGTISADSVTVNIAAKVVTYYLSPTVLQIPMRTNYILGLKTVIKQKLGRAFRDYSVSLIASGRDLEVFVPNYFRTSPDVYDSTRFTSVYSGLPLLTVNNRPQFSAGLSGNHIAVWPSHGYYFNQSLNRWQWQRARLFGTVEDIFPWAFTTQYLVPMLENSGATVLLPRERDAQVHEVVIDNDDTDGSSIIVINGTESWESAVTGFAKQDTLYPGQNPFKKGTFLSINSHPVDSARLVYVPDIPQNGNYAVYVSWGKTVNCASDVTYIITYCGGSATYTVNQCMGAETWIYLGTYWFCKGQDASAASVTVYNKASTGVVASDAVRFGGGMGNVARKTEAGNNWQTSNKPRWMEGSRYYLQYAGFPDSLVYNLTLGKNDYNDDYLSRGEWVNELVGRAKPQYNNKYADGKNIPVDLALAFHTDAGVTSGDSIIGTLAIFSTARNNGLFPNGQSKLASRDLADMIQSQVVTDIMLQVNTDWIRRGLWDREYSEAWRPAVPVMLLELLSHQNLADMKYGLDPRFKFLVSRAIYKAILHYLAMQNGKIPVIQPLPPVNMALEKTSGKTIKISWKPVSDPHEPTARATGYNLYMRTENEGFAPPVYVNDTFMLVTLPEWKTIYSFRVTALNEGGESMPGEILSVAFYEGDENEVLIVNAFDRVCGPAVFDEGDMAGLAWWEDEGVPRCIDYSFSGYQYDFNRNSLWLDDDSQGWGASYADREAIPLTGNTFDFPFIHGKALRDAGYSFVSVSDEVFESSWFNYDPYQVTDIIFGEERGTPLLADTSGKEFRVFTPAMIRRLSNMAEKGRHIFISGAYIGTDMTENRDSASILFAKQYLHYSWRTNHATNIGMLSATYDAGGLFPLQLQFNTGGDASLYRVESPDAIEPAGEGAFRIYRYDSGGRSAGIAFDGHYRTVVLGFPFETIIGDENRKELMGGIMHFLNADQPLRTLKTQ